MTKRTPALLVVLALTAVDEAAAQSPVPVERAPREPVAVGVLVTPALEGAGLWFMPGVRFTAPVGTRYGLDFDVGRIYGGANEYAEIKSYYAGQIRFARKARPDGTVTYWFAGLKYLDIIKIPRDGSPRYREPDVPGTLGYGGCVDVGKGVRATTEIGFSGGKGYLLFANIGIQWRLQRRPR